MTSREQTDLSKANRSRGPGRTLAKIGRFAAAILLAMVLLLLVAMILADNLPASRSIKEFISTNGDVKSLIGEVRISEVRVHQLNITSSNGALEVSATAVATRPSGQLRLQIAGKRATDEQNVQYRLKETSRVHCRFIYICQLDSPSTHSTNYLPRRD